MYIQLHTQTHIENIHAYIENIHTFPPRPLQQEKENQTLVAYILK